MNKNTPIIPAIGNVGGGGIFNALQSVGGNIGDLMSALQVQNVTQTLSAAQIKALHTTPITLIQAPGAGLFIYPLIWTFNLHFGTAAFTTNGTTDVYWGSSAGANMTNFDLDALLLGTANELNFGGGVANASGFVTPTEYVNQPLVVGATANPATGDGTLGISLTYVLLSAP